MPDKIINKNKYLEFISQVDVKNNALFRGVMHPD
jgi:hypothetical protein